MAMIRGAFSTCSPLCRLPVTSQSHASTTMLLCYKSTDATTPTPTQKIPLRFPDPAFEKIDFTFENPEEAYRSKPNHELLRAMVVFRVCTMRPIVRNAENIMKRTRKLLGPGLFSQVMKASFYGQFVAGYDTESIKPIIYRNLDFGVRPILDYSVEKDLESEEGSASPNQGATNSSGLDAQNEANCDENMKIFLDTVDCVADATRGVGVAAIKVTALASPQLLKKFSGILHQVRSHFENLSKTVGSASGSISEQDFVAHFRSMGEEEESEYWFARLDVNKDGEIDILDWHNDLETNLELSKILKDVDEATGALKSMETLTAVEEEAMRNLVRRVDTIAKHARDKDVQVMIDAEQTYYQTAINRLTMEMMRKYNREKAIVFNTYQCYLKDTHKRICPDLALAEREDFFFGAKLVRGAYMDQERELAQTEGYEDPVNPSYEATSAMYEKVLTETMKNITKRPKGKVDIVVASHNEETVRFALNRMHELGISSTDQVIRFGQLLGMCDQISFPLGQAGYSVYKYVPYGPVEEVLPYLSRRAVENDGLLDKVKKEKRMLRTELRRRLLSGKWIYRPSPPVTPVTQA